MIYTDGIGTIANVREDSGTKVKGELIRSAQITALMETARKYNENSTEPIAAMAREITR